MASSAVIAVFQLQDHAGVGTEFCSIRVLERPAGYRVIVDGGCLCSLDEFPEIVDGAGEYVTPDLARAIAVASAQFHALVACYL